MPAVNTVTTQIEQSLEGMLDTHQKAAELGIKYETLVAWRCADIAAGRDGALPGYPEYVRVGPKLIRYFRGVRR